MQLHFVSQQAAIQYAQERIKATNFVSELVKYHENYSNYATPFLHIEDNVNVLKKLKLDIKYAQKYITYLDLSNSTNTADVILASTMIGYLTPPDDIKAFVREYYTSKFKTTI
jgi:hypothetical protein